jgi:hypothetical protein
VFVDRTAELARVRGALRWYPPDVERYVLAAGWQRLARQLPMVGRTAQRGDELGSRLLSAALAADLMWLAFPLHQQWPPYPKWLGSMFQALPAAEELTAPLNIAVTGSSWQERESALASAAEVLLGVQHARGLPTPVCAVTAFWDRPYRTVDPTLPARLLAEVTDPHVARLPRTIGSIEQWVDSVEVLSDPHRRPAIQAAYRTWMDAG